MISVNDFKTGLTIEVDGGIWRVVDFQHVKPVLKSFTEIMILPPNSISADLVLVYHFLFTYATTTLSHLQNDELFWRLRQNSITIS